MMWLSFLLLLLGSTEAVEQDCPPCSAGKFCESQTCKPCPPGSFISDNVHSKTVCEKWTTKSGQNVIVVEKGSSTRDVVWGCDSGYEKYIFSLGGEWECREKTTTSSTTSTTTPTPSTTLKYLESTIKDGKSKEPENTNTIIIVVSVSSIVIIFVVGFVLFKCRKRNQDRNRNRDRNRNNDSNGNDDTHSLLSDITILALEPLFLTIVRVLGEDECKPFIDILDDPSRKFVRNQGSSNFSKLLHDWAECNPDINHSEYIVRALAGKGYHLPRDLIVTDTGMVTDSLNKAGELNLEFRTKFCSKLLDKLDPLDVDALVTRLGIKSDFDVKKHSNSDKIDIAFPQCLAKWAFKFPYVLNETRNWEPLTTLMELLDEIDRKDLVQNFETLVQEVKEKMEIFTPLHNGVAPVQNGAAPEVETQMSNA